METKERIETDAIKFSTYRPNGSWSNKSGVYNLDKYNAYIAGATKEASRNKEDAIGFAEFAKNHAYDFDYKRWFAQLESVGDDTGVTTEELYNNYINQKV